VSACVSPTLCEANAAVLDTLCVFARMVVKGWAMFKRVVKLNCQMFNSHHCGSAKVLLLIMMLIVSLCIGIYVSVRNADQSQRPSSNERVKVLRPNRAVESEHRIAERPSKPREKVHPIDEVKSQAEGATEHRTDKNEGTRSISPPAHGLGRPSIDALKAHLPSAIKEALDGIEVRKPVWQLELSRLSVSEGLVALSFDAHFTNEYVPPILEVLKRYNVRATFFVTGHWADSFPSTLKAIALHGHEIGNHTYSHPKLTELSDDEIVGEIKHAEQSILKAIGNDGPLTPYVRPPYGDRDERVVRVLLSSGYIPTYWAVDGLDWKKGVSEGEVIRRVVTKSTSGDIVLLHATSKVTSNSLSDIIEGLLQKGLQPCSVTELIMRAEVK